MPAHGQDARKDHSSSRRRARPPTAHGTNPLADTSRRTHLLPARLAALLARIGQRRATRPRARDAGHGHLRAQLPRRAPRRVVDAVAVFAGAVSDGGTQGQADGGADQSNNVQLHRDSMDRGLRTDPGLYCKDIG